MRTTLTVVLFPGSRAALTHVGDSRAFRLRGGQLRRITEDHTSGNLA
jgi:PPM family protein phosphatase